MIIGLTGLFCSGKSTVEEILKQKYDLYVIDADKTGHWALLRKKDEIVSKFGKEILIDGEISRQKLGETVFKDKNKLALLNSIVHPAMTEKIKEEIKLNKNRNILINAAVLFEMGLDRDCDKILIVKAPVLNIIKRAKKRNNYSFCKALRILNSQKVLKLAKKIQKKADIFYINNNKDLKSLTEQIKNILDERIFHGTGL